MSSEWNCWHELRLLRQKNSLKHYTTKLMQDMAKAAEQIAKFRNYMREHPIKETKDA